MKGATAFGGAYFGEGSRVVRLADVDCTGLETSLSSCPSSAIAGTYFYSCDHSDDAGVACAGATVLNCKHAK